MNRILSFDDTRADALRPTSAEPTRVRPAAKPPVAPPVRLDGTWQASSFDLAQGLEVKVMHSKLSQETLDRLFRG